MDRLSEAMAGIVLGSCQPADIKLCGSAILGDSGAPLHLPYLLESKVYGKWTSTYAAITG